MHTTIAWLATACLTAALPVLCTQTPDSVRYHPLSFARQNLLRARTLVVEHKYEEAVAPLLTAAEALAHVEQRDLGWKGRDAGLTRQAIQDYTRSIDTDNADAVDYINAWLNQVKLLRGVD
ncbi:MAG TPA: hypothetical protein VMB03_16015 [Bryobacteraceae bacterium]|nr:hypothetical protein [Bryobacteraceae bacterium]